MKGRKSFFEFLRLFFIFHFSIFSSLINKRLLSTLYYLYIIPNFIIRIVGSTRWMCCTTKRTIRTRTTKAFRCARSIGEALRYVQRQRPLFDTCHNFTIDNVSGSRYPSPPRFNIDFTFS
jgi:hypothetical protein